MQNSKNYVVVISFVFAILLLVYVIFQPMVSAKVNVSQVSTSSTDIPKETQDRNPISDMPDTFHYIPTPPIPTPEPYVTPVIITGIQESASSPIKDISVMNHRWIGKINDQYISVFSGVFTLDTTYGIVAISIPNNSIFGYETSAYLIDDGSVNMISENNGIILMTTKTGKEFTFNANDMSFSGLDYTPKKVQSLFTQKVFATRVPDTTMPTNIPYPQP